jgi:hypothetical protein
MILTFIALKSIDNLHVHCILKNIKVNNMELYFTCSSSSRNGDSDNAVVVPVGQEKLGDFKG